MDGTDGLSPPITRPAFDSGDTGKINEQVLQTRIVFLSQWLLVQLINSKTSIYISIPLASDGR